MNVEESFKIIIIDDDEKIIKLLKAKLNRYVTEGFTDAFLGIEKIKENKFDLLILDYLLIDIHADDVVQKIREFDKNIYIFLLTGCDKEMLQPLTALWTIDIQFYCEKSSDVDNVILSIENAIKSIGFLRKKNKKFSVRLKELRNLHGISQKELADYLGLKSRTAIANWESGLSEPSNEDLKKISIFFKVTIDYLLCHELDYCFCPR